MHDEEYNKCSKIKEIRCTLEEQLCSHVHANLENLDTEEVYKIADIIKDFYEAEKYCYEACYYKKVSEAMDEKEEGRGEYSNERWGYPKYGDWRHMNAVYGYPNQNGNYSTDSNRSGYPMYNEYPNKQERYMREYLNNPDFEENMRMGYPRGTMYESYRNSRRHYTETSSPEDKKQMEKRANEYVSDTMMTIKEMYNESDPEMKRKLKQDLTRVIGEMT